VLLPPQVVLLHLAQTLQRREGVEGAAVDVAERAAVRCAQVVQHQRDALRMESEQEARLRRARTMMLLLLLHRKENRHSSGSCRSTLRPENTVDSCLKRSSALQHI
jgi:hypothetical protein